MRDEEGGVNQIRGRFFFGRGEHHCVLPSKQTNLLFLLSLWEGPGGRPSNRLYRRQGLGGEAGPDAALAQTALQPLPTGPERRETVGGREGNARLDRDRGQETAS